MKTDTSDCAFTQSEMMAISKAFDAGNYAAAYESNLYETEIEDMGPHERAAFVLGFFGTLALHEISGEDRETFDDAYFSPAGRYVVDVAKYTDDRSEEYAAEPCSNPDCPLHLDRAAAHVDGACDE